jgi:hypothetical protein
MESGDSMTYRSGRFHLTYTCTNGEVGVAGWYTNSQGQRVTINECQTRPVQATIGNSPPVVPIATPD